MLKIKDRAIKNWLPILNYVIVEIAHTKIKKKLLINRTINSK